MESVQAKTSGVDGIKEVKKPQRTAETDAHRPKHLLPDGRLNIKYMHDRDREKIRGRFNYHELPGGILEFPFRAYAQDDVEIYSLKDGEIYELPRGVVRHLNKNVWYPVHKYEQDEEGKFLQKVGSKFQRCSFQSLEFFDEEDMTPAGSDKQIHTVERTPYVKLVR